jgi:hypothetical protein
LAADETVKELVLAKSRVVEELSRDMAETVKKTLMSEDR